VAPAGYWADFDALGRRTIIPPAVNHITLESVRREIIFASVILRVA
jgi:hypothetical protein